MTEIESNVLKEGSEGKLILCYLLFHTPAPIIPLYLKLEMVYTKQQNNNMEENEIIDPRVEKSETKKLEEEDKKRIDAIINSPYFFYYKNKEGVIKMLGSLEEKPGDGWVCDEEMKFRPEPKERAIRLWEICKESYPAFEYIISQYQGACMSFINSLLKLQTHLLPKKELGKIPPTEKLSDCMKMGEALVNIVEKLYKNQNDYLDQYLDAISEGRDTKI